jgi:hypothetical protein
VIETIISIKKNIERIEKEEGNIKNTEREGILRKLKEIDGDLKRFVLMHMAINKR